MNSLKGYGNVALIFLKRKEGLNLFETRAQIRQGYFAWLCEEVGENVVDAFRPVSHGLSYILLLGELHDRPFHSVIGNDDNRARDGLALREEYFSLTGLEDFGDLDDQCSVLEMLVALARRIDFELGTPYDYSNNVPRYFWEMMENLGLAGFHDELFAEEGTARYVDDILMAFLDRDYSPNGEGGLFPLVFPDEDQREVEIWDQMLSYLNENYDYEGQGVRNKNWEIDEEDDDDY